jgi:hypothetical protein
MVNFAQFRPRNWHRFADLGVMFVAGHRRKSRKPDEKIQRPSGLDLRRHSRGRTGDRLFEPGGPQLPRQRGDRGGIVHPGLDRFLRHQGRRPVGPGRGAAARPLPRPQGSRPVFHHSDHRDRRLLDRHPRHHEFVQGREDSHQGHGAGGCRRRAVLEGGRPEEGGARRGRLCERHQLGVADRASRCHRQDHAVRYAGGPRKKSAATCRRSSMRGRSPGASTSFRSRSRTC